ncbi:MAG: UvrD-helicase domain-containing protein [Alphaproteobacteria bacterium]
MNSRRPEVLYDDYHAVFLTADNQPRKNIATKKALAAYPEGADFALAEAERLTETDNKIAAARLLAATRAVLFLADDLIRGYNEYKKIHSKMDYEDLIVQTRELLENPGVADWVLYKLDGGIDNVLIDEAQDTSPDQWAIIRAITNEFLTGWVPRTKLYGICRG